MMGPRGGVLPSRNSSTERHTPGRSECSYPRAAGDGCIVRQSYIIVALVHFTPIAWTHTCAIRPAWGRNGTFSTLIYGPEAVRVVMEHKLPQPLFMYL